MTGLLPNKAFVNENINIRFKEILPFLIYFLISKFIFEPYNLLLEDETHSTRYHGHTTEHVLEQKPRITLANLSTCQLVLLVLISIYLSGRCLSTIKEHNTNFMPTCSSKLIEQENQPQGKYIIFVLNFLVRFSLAFVNTFSAEPRTF